MSSNEHIALFTPGFPENEKDFLCIPPLQDYLKALLKIPGAPRITVIAFQYPYHPSRYLWHGIPVIAVGGRNRKIPFKWLTWRKCRRAFEEVQARDPFTAIHSLWLNECALLGRRLSDRHGIPHFCTAMGQDVLNSNRYLRRLDFSRMKVAAVSEKAKEQLAVSAGYSRTKVIPWGLDTESLSPMNVQRDIDVLGVGSFTALKGYDVFIEAVRKLAGFRPGLKALLIGYGPEQARLEELIRQSGLTGLIRLQGLTPREEIFSLMARSRVLLHPGRFESFGSVFAEALAHGMQIVSRDVGIARPGSRWSIAEDAESMARACLRFLEQPQPDERMLLYTAEQTAEDYIHFFSEKPA